MRKLISILVLLVLITGCTQIDYIGKEYPPTENIGLFFSEENIEHEYEIMGRVVATAGDFVSSGKMQKSIMKKAREVGADAVVILGLERYQTGTSTSYTEETKDTRKGTKTTGHATSSTDEKKEVTALFVKYK